MSEVSENVFDLAHESWVNGQRKQMVNYLLNAPFSRGEFIQILRNNGVDKAEVLRIAIYLLDS